MTAPANTDRQEPLRDLRDFAELIERGREESGYVTIQMGAEYRRRIVAAIAALSSPVADGSEPMTANTDRQEPRD